MATSFQKLLVQGIVAKKKNKKKNRKREQNKLLMIKNGKTGWMGGKNRGLLICHTTLSEREGKRNGRQLKKKRRDQLDGTGYRLNLPLAGWLLSLPAGWFARYGKLLWPFLEGVLRYHTQWLIRHILYNTSYRMKYQVVYVNREKNVKIAEEKDRGYGTCLIF